jgi:beta-lactamase class A
VTTLSDVFVKAGVDGFFHARNIDTDEEVGHASDELVILASVFKVPVLVELFRQSDAWSINLAEQVEVPAEGRAGGPTNLSVMRYPLRMAWWDLALSMIVVSDNAATDVVCERVGLENVNASMRELGLPQTRLFMDCRRIYRVIEEDAGVESQEELTPEKLPVDVVAGMRCHDPEQTNRSIPRELTRLLQLIWRDEAASPEACADMRTILGHQVWPHRLASGFPETDFSGRFSPI